MLERSNGRAIYCYERAAEARRRADLARSATERANCLDIELRWLRLADSYEFTERLQRFLDGQQKS